MKTSTGKEAFLEKKGLQKTVVIIHKDTYEAITAKVKMDTVFFLKINSYTSIFEEV